METSSASASPSAAASAAAAVRSEDPKPRETLAKADSKRLGDYVSRERDVRRKNNNSSSQRNAVITPHHITPLTLTLTLTRMETT